MSTAVDVVELIGMETESAIRGKVERDDTCHRAPVEKRGRSRAARDGQTVHGARHSRTLAGALGDNAGHALECDLYEGRPCSAAVMNRRQLRLEHDRRAIMGSNKGSAGPHGSGRGVAERAPGDHAARPRRPASVLLGPVRDHRSASNRKRSSHWVKTRLSPRSTRWCAIVAALCSRTLAVARLCVPRRRPGRQDDRVPHCPCRTPRSKPARRRRLTGRSPGRLEINAVAYPPHHATAPLSTAQPNRSLRIRSRPSRIRSRPNWNSSA